MTRSLSATDRPTGPFDLSKTPIHLGSEMGRVRRATKLSWRDWFGRGWLRRMCAERIAFILFVMCVLVVLLIYWLERLSLRV
jgi:hypothetical protein